MVTRMVLIHLLRVRILLRVLIPHLASDCYGESCDLGETHGSVVKFGRHARFRSLWGKLRAGSSPVTPTHEGNQCNLSGPIRLECLSTNHESALSCIGSDSDSTIIIDPLLPES